MLLKRRSWLLLANLALLLALVAACATPAAAPAQNTGGTESVAAENVGGGLVNVTYSYGASGIPRDLQQVQDALNTILNEDIGVNLTLEPIDYAAYNDRMQLQLAAGETCDIIFTAPWINSYTNNVANGSLLELDDLLKEEAPGLWASMPESTWDAARINGKIYGVINQQIFPKPWGVHVRKDLLEKYNFSLDTVTKWEDMEPFLEAVKEGEGITPVYADDSSGSSLWRSQYYGYDPLDDGLGFVGIKADDETLTVVNVIETSEYRDAANLSKKWVDAGYFPSTPTAADEARAAFRAGLFAMGYHVEKPGNDVEMQTAVGWEFEIKNLTDPLILDTAGATATLNGICATSEHPIEAMRVLEKLNTDPEVYNLLARGIEGVHWVWEDEANKVIKYPDGVDSSNSGYEPNTDWMFGNQFNAYYRSQAQVGAWEATKKMNDEAYPSQALGFVVDRTPIQTEVAQVTAVLEELGRPIAWGWVAYDDAAPELLDRINAAGAQTIIDEVQRQLNDWKAAQGQ
ncbi:MAG: ABC transporter substrate-binding protein [Caldilineaceae bacterium]|nr:ABC transporter substrate-binding protein [Caldilineaceae bacterium]